MPTALELGELHHGEVENSGPSGHEASSAGYPTTLHQQPLLVPQAPMPRMPKFWLSFWLRWYTLSAACGLTLILVGGIIALIILSGQNQGIATVQAESTHIWGFIDFGIGLLWTFLPTLIFQGYGFLVSAIVKAAAARQPYIELAAPGNVGAAAQKSVLLDYATWIAPWALYKAFTYGHFMLASCMAVSLLIQLGGAPLASHLLDTQSLLVSSLQVVNFTSTFDESAFDERSDMAPVLDIAAATKVYNGTSIPWTTNNASLLPFDVDPAFVGNITAETKHYAVSFDCRSLDPSDYSLAWNQAGGAWFFSMHDRGCDMPSILFTSSLSGFQVSFAETYSINCPASAGISRIVLVAATDEDASQSNFTRTSVVSCTLDYASGNGSATVSSDGTTLSLVNYEKPTSILLTDPRPLFATNFEQQIVQPGIIDDTDTTQATRLGSLILTYAQTQYQEAYLDGSNLVNATYTILSAAFNIMIQRVIVQPSNSTSIQGLGTRGQNRLYVVTPVAWTLVAILLATLAMLIALHIYTASRSHGAGQYEEPKALLGAAAVVCNSELLHEVARFKSLTTNGKLAEKASKVLVGREKTGWKFVDLEVPSQARLVSTPYARNTRKYRA